MSTPLVIQLPLDPSGVSPDNLVTGEPHTLIANRNYRCIAPDQGAFYANSLKVYDGTTLLTTEQYYACEMYELPSERYGAEIDAIIIINDTSVSNNVTITYQALGGPYGTSAQAIIQQIEALQLDDRPVAWGDIIGKPSEFPPSYHLHDIGDVYGFEYVVHALDRIRDAILIGDQAAFDAVYRYIDAAIAQLQSLADGLRADLDEHVNDFTNPHRVTATQVGLGNVANYPVATTAQASAGTTNAAYMTPLLTAGVMTTARNALQVEIDTHLADFTNPHRVTATQVGLGSVQNFPLATTAQATAGTSNATYMTPALTASAVGVAQSTLQSEIDNHLADFANPHRVTSTQVGLGNVQNYPVATQDQALAGTSTTAYMTPALVQAVVSSSSGALGTELEDHLSDFTNPHRVTATQLGVYTQAQSNAITTPISTALTNLTNSYNAEVASLQNQINGKQAAGNYAVLYTAPTFSGVVSTGGISAAGTIQAGGDLDASGNLSISGTIYCANDIWAFNSDGRLKEKVRKLESALEKVRKVRGVLYRYRPEARQLLGMEDREYMGFIAQEVQAVCPEIVALAPFDRSVKTGESLSGENFITIQYDKYAALLNEAVKELDDKVEYLYAHFGVLSTAI